MTNRLQHLEQLGFVVTFDTDERDNTHLCMCYRNGKRVITSRGHFTKENAMEYVWKYLGKR